MVTPLRSRWLPWLAAAWACGCIPTADSAAFLCTPDGGCPANQVCAGGLCYATNAVPDAGPADAGAADGGTDAGPARVCPEAAGCSLNVSCESVLGCVCASYLAAADCCLPPSSSTACRADSDCCFGDFAGAGCMNGRCACLPAGQTCNPLTTGTFCCANLKCQTDDDAGNHTCQ